MDCGQKLFSLCCFATLIALSSDTSYALGLSDVPEGYWAYKPISYSVQQNYIELKNGDFCPEAPITRGEFANLIYTILERNIEPLNSNFKDVDNSTKYNKSIRTLGELKVLFGYPDGNFRPESNLKRSEASSMIANVIRSSVWKKEVLDNFKDKDEIPNWAKDAYINDIINNIYVNYPISNELNPEKELTRAQAAVLAVKLNDALEIYKASYLLSSNSKEDNEINEEENKEPKPVYIGTNTLEEMKNAFETQVEIYDTKKIIKAGNIIPIKALQKVDSRTLKEGDILSYISPKDIYSAEGQKLYSEGTKFVGYVNRTGKSAFLKKQDKAHIIFNKAILTNGNEFPIAGVLYSTYKGKVVKEKDKNSKKIQKDITKKYPRNISKLKLTEKLSPLVKYKDDTKNTVFMLLVGDMILKDENNSL